MYNFTENFYDFTYDSTRILHYLEMSKMGKKHLPYDLMWYVVGDVLDRLDLQTSTN